jgi:site-specific DNA-methyltransferase (adenine-specific)
MTASWRVIEGDCLEHMAAMPDASVDSIVTDPPYGLGFMGREWDALPPGLPWARECLRVLKPGGHLLAFGGTRTYHRLACAIEDAGFEIRDCLAWLYGSGFPKSLDVSKAIDKAAGAERETIGPNPTYRDSEAARATQEKWNGAVLSGVITAPATPDAETWQGWGTALKPAHEPIVLARKPLAGTVAANVLAHGTGALNVDGCRIENGEQWQGSSDPSATTNGYGPGDEDGWKGNWTKRSESHAAGRWPANVCLDPEAAAMLDEQTGEMRDGVAVQRNGGGQKPFGGIAAREGRTGLGGGQARDDAGYGGSGGASRFLYVAKASSEERNRGGTRNTHPTVKPVELMRWLCRLITPPGGTVLDPFTGSGTTGIAAMREGFRFIGIEREPDYVAIARARIIGDAPLLNSGLEEAA